MSVIAFFLNKRFYGCVLGTFIETFTVEIPNLKISKFRFYQHKKSLKIPKGYSESVYRRRTENTMTKRKCTKGQTAIYKTYT
jgi:hypothetical protein